MPRKKRKAAVTASEPAPTQNSPPSNNGKAPPPHRTCPACGGYMITYSTINEFGSGLHPSWVPGVARKITQIRYLRCNKCSATGKEVNLIQSVTQL